MAKGLAPVALALSDTEVPQEIAVLITESQRRVDAFFEERQDDPIPGFVPCDFELAYRSLVRIRDGRLAPGTSFCEWGSGYGVVAVLAARLGFEASGIESEGPLVEAAQRLADEYAPGVEFVQGSFIPEGAESTVDREFEFDWLQTGHLPAYETLGLDVRDFDLIFAYPWPGEEDVVFELFDDHASRGALLLTFHGDEGMKLQRKR